MSTITFPSEDCKRNGRPVATFEGKMKNEWVKVIYIGSGRSKLVWNGQMQRYDLKTVLGDTKNYAKVSEYTLGKELQRYLEEPRNDPWCYVTDTYYGHKMLHNVVYVWPEKEE